MTGFNHIITGIGIAVTVRHPIAAPLLAFVSHFVLDALPHYDPGYYGPHQAVHKHFKFYILFEAMVIISILAASVFLFQAELWLVLLCAVAAILPDIFWLAEKAHGHRYGLKQFYTFHTIIQWGERRWGWTIELVYFAIISVTLLQYIKQ